MATNTMRAKRPLIEVINDYYELTKPRIVMLLAVTGMAALWVSAPGVPSFSLFLSTLAGIALSAGSANALNCYVDRDIDAVMKRTMNRPLPAGRLKPPQALAFGILTGIASFILLTTTVNLLSAVVAVSGILFYVFIYTLWLKRSTPLNIVIGGAAGSVPPLIGWAAATNRIDLPAVLLFLIIFLWTPPHFWALALFRSEEYAKAKVPMLPVVRGNRETKRQILLYTIYLVAASLAISFTDVGGPIYTAISVALGANFIRLAWQTYRDESDRLARRLFGFSIVYLAAIFLALVIQAL